MKHAISRHRRRRLAIPKDSRWYIRICVLVPQSQSCTRSSASDQFVQPAKKGYCGWQYASNRRLRYAGHGCQLLTLSWWARAGAQAPSTSHRESSLHGCAGTPVQLAVITILAFRNVATSAVTAPLCCYRPAAGKLPGKLIDRCLEHVGQLHGRRDENLASLLAVLKTKPNTYHC